MKNLIQAFENDADVQRLRDLYFYKTIPEILSLLAEIGEGLVFDTQVACRITKTVTGKKRR